MANLACSECGLTMVEAVFLASIDKEALKRILFRLNDATQEVNAGDRATLIRMLEPLTK